VRVYSAHISEIQSAPGCCQLVDQAANLTWESACRLSPCWYSFTVPRRWPSLASGTRCRPPSRTLQRYPPSSVT